MVEEAPRSGGAELARHENDFCSRPPPAKFDSVEASALYRVRPPPNLPWHRMNRPQRGELASEPPLAIVRRNGVQLLNDGPVLLLGLGGLRDSLARLRATLGSHTFDHLLRAEGHARGQRLWDALAGVDDGAERVRHALTLTGEAGYGTHLLSSERAPVEAIFECPSTWEGRYQQGLGVCWGSAFLAGTLAGLCERWFGVSCACEQTSFIARGEPFDRMVVRPGSEAVPAALSDEAAALDDLARAKAELAQLNEDLRERIGYLERHMEGSFAPTPILQVARGVLTLSIAGGLDDDRRARIAAHLLEAIVQNRARFAIIDVSAMIEFDVESVERLAGLARTIATIGARCVMVGIQPAVARCIVDLGVDMRHVLALPNLQEAIDRCTRELADAAGK
jgi:rsbT co-antagonist protein RsbR